MPIIFLIKAPPGISVKSRGKLTQAISDMQPENFAKSQEKVVE